MKNVYSVLYHRLLELKLYYISYSGMFTYSVTENNTNLISHTPIINMPQHKQVESRSSP